MQIGPIQIPDDLLKAQMAGELAIFAGAGISMPPPSGLPDFAVLAGRIGETFGESRFGNEPCERFLGRLAEKGLGVHSESAKILLDPSKKPTPLHHLLLKLFDRQPIRLVTTNFDAHFDAVIAESCPHLPTYVAPALPLGDQFQGLVYLHGSARRNPQDCVLTDSDFGRAYLFKGWARRFLVDLFSRYTIAFVGYSHSDVVVSYLARAMPPERLSRRFAFVPEGEAGDWELLQIPRITYPKAVGSNEHQALTDGIQAWVRLSQQSLIEKGQRVRDIASAPPPPDGEDTDFLRWAFEDLTLRRTFAGHALDPRWLSWMDRHKLLDPLFTPHSKLTELDGEFVVWLAREFHGANSEHFLAVIHRHGGRLHPNLMWRLLRFLDSAATEGAAPENLGRWVAVFAAQDPTCMPPEWWLQLLELCSRSPAAEPFLLAFETITRPYLQLSDRWIGLSAMMGDSRIVSFGVSVTNTFLSGLDQIWSAWSVRHLPSRIGCLLPIIEGNLAAAQRLRLACEAPTDDGDFFRVERESVESREPRWRYAALDCLVDAARDVLTHLLKTEPARAASLIDRWYTSGSSLLHRLAITGVAKRGDLSSDAKLEWLLHEELLFRHRPEISGFLESTYSSASETIRGRVLAQARCGPARRRYSQVYALDPAKEAYHLILCLARCAPDCHLTSTALAEMRRDHPNWSPCEEPKLRFFLPGQDEANQPLDVDLESLVSSPPDSFLGELAQAPADPFHPKPRERYVATIGKAVVLKPEWGILVLKALDQQGIPHSSLWSEVCFAWRQATPNDAQWAEILAFAASRDEPIEFLKAFVDVLDPGRQREQAVPESLAVESELVAQNIWVRALKDLPEEDLNHDDWLHQTINRPAGRLTEFWFARLAAARTAAGDAWSGIPPSLRTTIVSMITDSGASGAYARIVFTSHLVHFMLWDDAFARSQFYPLLSWAQDERRAEQCWHGFLWGRRWLPALVTDLLPDLEGVLDRAKELPERLQELLGWHVAYLVLVGLENRLRADWLNKAVHRLPETSEIHFCHCVERSLEDQEVASRDTHWQNWLGAYWRKRVDGIPRLLTPRTAEALARWVVHVGQFFPEAVGLVLRMGPSCLSGHWDLLSQLVEKGLIRDHPEPAAELTIRYLEQSENRGIPPKCLADASQEFHDRPLTPETRRRLDDALFRAGHTPGA